MRIDWSGIPTYTYYIDNPGVIFNNTFRYESLNGFIETCIKTGGDEAKYILKKGTVWFYWNGVDWVESDGTYSQANTADEIDANKGSFTQTAVVTQVKAFLHSDII